MTAEIKVTKRETLNIRIAHRAARLRGQNRTDFILDAARRAAEEALLDRTLITVSPEAFKEFVKRLDTKPKPNARLRKAMGSAAPHAMDAGGPRW
jgi:uncharacterized protein (DUF1778 family)